MDAWRTLPLTLWNGEVAHCWLHGYDAAGFHSGYFDRAGIACPASVGRSVTRRQASFFYGRVAARQALAGFGLAHHSVGIGPRGEPLWPDTIIGSITHTDVHVAAVALPGQGHGGIGIDIEECVDESGAAALMQTTVNTAELAYLRSLVPGLSLDRLLTIVFSAKESFYKAAFRQVGRLFDFSAVEVTRIDVREGAIVMTVREHLSPQLHAGSVQRAHYMLVDADTVFTWCSLPPIGSPAIPS